MMNREMELSMNELEQVNGGDEIECYVLGNYLYNKTDSTNSHENEYYCEAGVSYPIYQLLNEAHERSKWLNEN